MKDNISFAELAKKRQSDRKYKDQAVEREKLIQCLETARISPSANNSQPWKFIVVDDFEKKEQIAECSIELGMNKFTHQCPVIVAVVLEKQNFMSTIGSMIKNKDYSLFDIGIAVNQFCLQAADLGLGTCIIGWFDEKKIKKILGVRNRRIPLLISVGYPDAPTRDKVRKPLEMMSSWNEY
jgi:nitroreductase